MEPITTAQIRALQAIIARRGLFNLKDDMILEASNQRTTHISQLSRDEARSLIGALNTNTLAITADAASVQKMCSKIIAIAHKLEWIKKVAVVEGDKVKEKNDYSILDKWMKESSYLKKELRKYTLSELPKLVAQVESIYKYYLSKNG